MTDKEILKPLIDRTLDLAQRQKEQFKKELWAKFNGLEPVEKIPVCVTFELIPDSQWNLMFGANHLRCNSELARQIEFDLKKRTWAAHNIPDDHVLWPVVFVPAVQATPHSWGVPIEWHSSTDPEGAKEIIAPFAESVDLSKLQQPRTQIDAQATSARVEEAADLLSRRLPVQVRYPRMNDAPFDIAVEMRGLEKTMLDVSDHPERLHALLDFLTTAIIADHRHRQEQGWINATLDPSDKYLMVPVLRHVSAAASPGFAGRKPHLSDEWAYISAQTSSGLGPDMYAQFVAPYNNRLAELYTNKTVYYHGCECLDQKLDAIAQMPNLRRHHVSPWSSLPKAVEKYQGSVVLEVHVHPAEVLLNASKEQMRAEIDKLIKEGAGHPMCLNLSDIHSLAGNPATLKFWAQAAQEALEDPGFP